MVPVPPPDLTDRRMRSVPLARERLQFHLGLLGRRRRVDRTAGPPPLPSAASRRRSSGWPHQVHDAQLYLRLRIRRGDGLRKPLQPVHAGMMKMSCTPRLLQSRSVPAARTWPLRWPMSTTPRTSLHPSILIPMARYTARFCTCPVVAHPYHQRVQVHDRIERVQRPALPRCAPLPPPPQSRSRSASGSPPPRKSPPDALGFPVCSSRAHTSTESCRRIP